MSKSGRLRQQDIRILHCLVGECRDLGDDRAGWMGHLLRQLGTLARTGTASWYEEQFERSGAPPTLAGSHDWGFEENGFDMAAYTRLLGMYAVYSASWCPMRDPYMAALTRQNGVALSRPALIRDAEWYRSHYYREAHGDTGADAMLFCYFKQTNRMPGIVLVRPRGEADFSARQVRLVQEAFALVRPLVGGPLANFGEPSPSELPSRVRQVLQCLLQGDSDKQIAARLRISKHTVNQYIKVIFLHFGVQSRPELLARWIRRGWGARFAWADE